MCVYGVTLSRGQKARAVPKRQRGGEAERGGLARPALPPRPPPCRTTALSLVVSLSLQATRSPKHCVGGFLGCLFSACSNSLALVDVEMNVCRHTLHCFGCGRGMGEKGVSVRAWHHRPTARLQRAQRAHLDRHGRGVGLELAALGRGLLLLELILAGLGRLLGCCVVLWAGVRERRREVREGARGGRRRRRRRRCRGDGGATAAASSNRPIPPSSVDPAPCTLRARQGLVLGVRLRARRASGLARGRRTGAASRSARPPSSARCSRNL